MQSIVQPWSVSFAAALCLTTQAPQVPPNGLESERHAASERYARVESELLARDLGELTPEQREARANLLAVLDAYRTRADFGINAFEPGARVPLFVDGEGRRCAMAELLHATGQDDLVEAVRASNNQAWIVDLAGHGSFLDWLDANGLSLAEAARIQGPSMAGPGRVSVGEPGDVTPRGRGTPREQPVTPAPSTPSDSGAPAPSGPITPGVGGPSAGGFTPTPGPSLPSGDAFTWTEDAASWWLWWEFNKIEFLRPNRAVRDRVDDAGPSVTSYTGFVRSVMKPAVLHALEDGDPEVRGAAALAFGRIGGADAVEPLLELVQGTNARVRELAILGLGATGSPKAQEALLSLAREERLPDSTRQLGREVQPLAVVALGIGRQTGFAAEVDAEILELVATRSLSDREPLGVAAMMYATLAPNPALRALALELASDGGEPVSVRCRAVESLRGASDEPTLSKLQHLASGARIELRRSAALVLGEYRHALAVPALLTAYDLEKDQLTRAFLLVSLGRRGGDQACARLLEELVNGPKALRPWVALALGLVARDEADSSVAQVLREQAATQKNAQARAAFWLASGLARDTQAIPAITQALESDAAPRNRMYAATALALIGGDPARTALLERLGDERSEMASSAIALALGVLGRDGDSDVIAEVLAGTRDAMFQGQVSSAMAFHGSNDALLQINGWVASDELARATRAAALDGLGLMLGSCEPLALGAVARSANYTLFAPWTTSMLATTL